MGPVIRIGNISMTTANEIPVENSPAGISLMKILRSRSAAMKSGGECSSP